jgi:hypothetical protein
MCSRSGADVATAPRVAGLSGAPRCDERDAGKPARDLEAPAGDVLMWHAIFSQVQERPEQKRPSSRAPNDAGGARRDVQRDDHCATGLIQVACIESSTKLLKSLWLVLLSWATGGGAAALTVERVRHR